MGRVKRHLMVLFLRRPVLVGTVSVLLVVGIGLAGATPWLEWWQATPAPDGTAFALQRAFAEEASAVMPRTVSDFALTDLTGRQVGLREQVGKVILVNFITTRCATACVQVTRELQGLQRALGARMDRICANLTGWDICPRWVRGPNVTDKTYSGMWVRSA